MTVPTDNTPRIAAALARSRQASNLGDGFASFDLARKAAQRHPGSLALAYQATLQAARIGALSEAVGLYARFDIARRIAAGEADPLVSTSDLLALPARLAKDLALETSGPERTTRLTDAAREYRQVFERTGSYYPLINAATLLSLAGRDTEAAKDARQTLALLASLAASADSDDSLWRLLTSVEAHLILGQIGPAREAARRAAAAFHGDYGGLSTTIRQLDRLVAAKSLVFDTADALRMPAVLLYSGHIIAPPGAHGRFPAAQEAEVTAGIEDFLDTHRIGWAYGSLAAGADVLIAEALSARSIPLHIVLPFDEAEFIDVSVRPSGTAWLARYARCRRRAKTCRTVVEGSYSEDDSLFRGCADHALGLARLQSAHLGTRLLHLLVWDGASGPSNVAGTAADHDRSSALGIEAHVIPTTPDKPPASERNRPMKTRAPSRQARAMVFADVVGFSRITDDDLPGFLNQIMIPMAASVAELPQPARIVETWGDAVFLAYDDVEAAAAAAVRLIRVLRAQRGSLQSPMNINLRVSAHFGPTYYITNPFTKRPGCLGVHVSRAARIEPVTPPGVVYVSEAFAAQLALHPQAPFRTDFVGKTKLAKKFGELPIFRLLAASPED